MVCLVLLLLCTGISNKIDSSSNTVGRRYARSDEQGTPYGITIDYETVAEETVTVRERDSMVRQLETYGGVAVVAFPSVI